MDRLKKAITRGRARLIYRPLQSNEIRILTLKPGSGPDPIACTLRHVSLDDQPEYEALSYTWGDPKNTRKILVDGKKLQVTANLFDALENFRDPQQRIVLWVDAICVNQCDLAERGQQVKLMRRVFSQGRRTKVWLGLEDNDSDLATDFLEETLSGFNDGRNFEKELSALSQLFQRPWWFRIWVVQEVVVSKNLAFFCGKRQISWPKILEVYESIRAASYFGLHNWYGMQRVSAIITLSVVFKDPEHINRDLQMSMLCLLSKHRTSLASDPRDKCIALKGLSVNTDIREPDNIYSLPVEDVYTSTMVDIANRAKAGPLNFLAYSGQPRKLKNLPSWVPDWSCREEKMIFPNWQLERYTDKPFDRFDVIGAYESKEESVFQFADEGGALLARGFLFDKIDGFAPINCQGFLGLTLLPPRSDGWDSDSGSQQPFNKHTAYPVGEPIDDVLWKTFCFNRDENGAYYGAEAEEQRKHIFYTLFAAVLEDQNFIPGSDPAPTFGAKPERPIEGAKVDIAAVDPGYLPIMASWWNNNEGLEVCNGVTVGDIIRRNQSADYAEVTIEEFALCFGCIAVAIYGRRLAVSQKGYLCLVPAYTEQGDIIAVLLGCDVPVVLRRRRDYYECIGVCYVHGIMQGEAMAGVHDSDLQTFDIR